MKPSRSWSGRTPGRYRPVFLVSQPVVMQRLLPLVFILLFPVCASVHAQDIPDFWPDENQCRASSGTDNRPYLRGWCLAIDRNRGNCLACHAIEVRPWPRTLSVAGNIASPLSQMKKRFPDRVELRKHIWNQHIFDPASIMPPFGKHQILTESEIDAIVDFLLTV